MNRFGGGPMVSKLEVCSMCKALLDNYSERRKKEKDDIHRVCVHYFVLINIHEHARSLHPKPMCAMCTV